MVLKFSYSLLANGYRLNKEILLAVKFYFVESSKSNRDLIL